MQAPAKLNLYLEVTGQRGDGYHLLDSMVVFLDLADSLEVKSESITSLKLHGEFAPALDGANIVLKAAELLGDNGAEISLEKNIPVSAGLGGGSTDAAAALLLLANLWKVKTESLSTLALKLGADVPACLYAQRNKVSAVLMKGIGEYVSLAPALPEFYLALVNPLKSVSTKEVFKRLEIPPMETAPEWHGGDLKQFISFLKTRRNDLEDAAKTIAPEIDDVLTAIQKTSPLLTRMTGSGATCFGIYATEAEAKTAAEKLAKTHQNWWVRYTKIASWK